MKRIKYFIVLLLVFITSTCFVGCFGLSDEDGKIYYLNEIATNRDNVQFSVTKVENTKQIGGDYLGDKTDNNFIIVTIKVYNNSNKSIKIYGGSAELYNSNNVEYDEFSTLFIDDIVVGVDVGVGMTKTYQMAFEVPTTTDQSTYTLKIGYSIYTSKADRVNVILKNRDGSSTINGSSGSSELSGNYYHSKNEVFSFYGLEFKVTAWGRSQYYPPSNNNNEFVDVYIDVYNPTNKSVDLDYISFAFVYENGATYLPRWGYIADYIQTFGSIDPLEKIDALIGFEIPLTIYNGTGKCELRVSKNSTSATEFHYVTSRN